MISPHDPSFFFFEGSSYLCQRLPIRPLPVIFPLFFGPEKDPSGLCGAFDAFFLSDDL